MQSLQACSLEIGYVVERASRAGIAPGPAAVIERLRNRPVKGRGTDQSDLRELKDAIQRLRDALEQSPVPEFEWGSLLEVFDADELASLQEGLSTVFDGSARGTREGTTGSSKRSGTWPRIQDRRVWQSWPGSILRLGGSE